MQRYGQKSEKTHCKRGHPLTPDNVYVEIHEPYNRRHCRACMRVRWRNRGGDTNVKKGNLKGETVERILIALRAGQTTSRICGGMQGQTYVGGKIVNIYALKAYIAKGTEEGAEMARLIGINASGVLRTRSARLLKPKSIVLPTPRTAPFVIRRTGSWMDGETLSAVNQVGERAPVFMRDEVRQELLLLLWSGQIQPAEIPAVGKRLLSRQYRDYDSLSKWGHISLDKPLNGETDSTLMDIISEDQRLWG